jgi:hypothetical protein
VCEELRKGRNGFGFPKNADAASIIASKDFKEEERETGSVFGVSSLLLLIISLFPSFYFKAPACKTLVLLTDLGDLPVSFT